MPVYLNKDGEKLTVRLSGLAGSKFTETLATVKAITGRRWNPEAEWHAEQERWIGQWELPADPETAQKLVTMLQPSMTAEVKALIREHHDEISDALLTRTAEDAELQIDWADRLWPWQRGAVDFLVEHPHSILADEMGLGKTAQALAACHEWCARNSHDPRTLDPGLVVCPNAAKGVWVGEAEKWLDPPPTTQVIDGRTLPKRRAQLSEKASLYIVNWEALRTGLIGDLAERRWGAVIADEAHRAKNPKAKQTAGLWKLAAPIQLALTGTPILNDPAELWSLLRWLRPEQYGGKPGSGAGGGYQAFFNQYVEGYQVIHGKRRGYEVTGVKNPDKLRFELADKMVRRTRAQVFADRPGKLPAQTIPVELDRAQRKVYEEIETQLVLDIQTFAAESDDFEPEDFADMPLAQVARLIPNAGAKITLQRRLTSQVKLRAAEELIRDHPNKPFVTFTWFVDSARELSERLEKGKPPITTGVVASTDDPTDAVGAFQTSETDQLVSTIAKGGVALTLTRPDTAIFVDRDWVPGINEQAEDRLRPGHPRLDGRNVPISVIILEVPDTVDTGKVAPKNRLKQRIVEQVLG
jgi:SNF2 family DNA or RNA helicase